MKKLSLLLFASLCFVGSMLAQRTVSGTLTDQGGEPLIGANVIVKGTTAGTITDFDGSYSVSVPDGSTTLVFSYAGFTTQEVNIDGRSVINAVLSEGLELDEIVVTGLGIKKEKKALGYAVTTIGSGDINLRAEADVGRVLRGKVPGVDISQTSGLAGSGTNIIIRGYSSITGTNQPLFVVDGVPFNSDTNNDRSFASGGATASSRFLDLDPNNIAEVSVLKGLSATVLYGEAGRNGVVLVTTKSGNSGNIDQKMEVTIDQSVFATQAASAPDDQDRWGNGFHNFASGAFSNWGAGMTPELREPNDGVAADGTVAHPYDRSALRAVFPQYIGARHNYVAYDNLQNFFGTGLTNNTSVNVSNRLSDGTSINFNYGYRDEDGFVPLSNYTKHNFSLGATTELGNGIRYNGTFNFILSDRTAPPTGVSFSSNPTGASLFSNIYYVPRSVDLWGWEYNNPADNTPVFYRPDIQNPRWTLDNTYDNEKVSRIFATSSFSKDITDFLSITYRLGLDRFNTLSEYGINKNGVQVPLGQLVNNNRTNTIINHDFLATYDTNLTSDLTLDGVVGFNIRADRFELINTSSSDQLVFGNFQHDNFVQTTANTFVRAENLLGLFATASLGYKNYLYVNFQGRNDWTSTLEMGNNTIFYPSASVSFIPTDAFEGLQNNNLVNFLKLRMGYGTSAGYPNPYQTRGFLGSSTRAFTSPTGGVINTNTVANRIGNPDLRPEIHRELEFGLEGQFIDNRIGIDLSLYNKNSSNLIIDLDLDPSTGYTATTVNVAEVRNRGIELGVNITPIRTKDVIWRLNANYTRNQPLIRALSPSVSQFPFAGYTNLGNFAIAPLEITGDVDPADYPDAVEENGFLYFPYGIIQGVPTLRNENGDLLVTSAGTYQSDPNLGVLGNPNPDYILNGGTEISVKGITLNALFSFSKGGVIFATTPSTLMGRGILQETDFDRYVPVIAPGVLPNGDGTYRPNDIQITSTQHYWINGGVFQDEMRMYDATYLKLRELSLSYDIPKSVLNATPFGAIRLQLSGQNLWFDAFGFPDGANFDPEVLGLGVGNGRGFELMNVPTARQFGGSVRVTF